MQIITKNIQQRAPMEIYQTNRMNKGPYPLFISSQTTA